MNRGQHRFHDYILERVHEDRVEDAKHLLTESFQKEDDRSFDHAYLNEHFMPRMKEMLRTEHLEEVNGLMEGFGER